MTESTARPDRGHLYLRHHDAPFTRVLGSSGIETSALGMGCWAIGGPWSFNGAPAGWSAVDDAESLRALDRAFDLGVTFFDTAANYGAGHSERLLGQAFRRRRDARRHRHEVRLRGRRGRPVRRQSTTTTRTTATSPAGCARTSRRACSDSRPTTSTSTSCTSGDWRSSGPWRLGTSSRSSSPRV